MSIVAREEIGYCPLDVVPSTYQPQIARDPPGLHWLECWLYWSRLATVWWEESGTWYHQQIKFEGFEPKFGNRFQSQQHWKVSYREIKFLRIIGQERNRKLFCSCILTTAKKTYVSSSGKASFNSLSSISSSHVQNARNTASRIVKVLVIILMQ